MAQVPGKVTVPKRIPVELLRKVIGDKRTDEILTVAFGPKLLGTSAVKVRKDVLERYLAAIEGRTIDGAPTYQMIPAVFRAYYAESPQAKGRFMVWLRKKVSGDEQVETQDAIANTQSGNGVEQAATEMAHDTIQKRVIHRTASMKPRKTKREKANANR